MEQAHRVLITAFEPFGGASVNTSLEVQRRLPDRISSWQVTKVTLPVVFGRAAAEALRHPADFIVLLGEAGKRTAVTPELNAKNVRNARIPDNAGGQPMQEVILPGGLAMYHTAVPVERIVEQMQAEGFEIAVSDDAGTFVCNDTYYLVGTASRIPVVFVHVPAIPAQADAYAGTVCRFIEIAAALTMQRSPTSSLF